MLCNLSISNVVLIDKLDLDFADGLSVLTGETGAGKSILLDSLGLVLGGRADTAMIRHGEDKLGVIATFSKPAGGHPVFQLAAEYDIELDGEEITVKRTLGRDGKGKIFVNDQLVSAKILKEIGQHLVEVHGQFDNQGLLNQANHKDILDTYGRYSELLQQVKTGFDNYKSAVFERETFEAEIAKAKVDEENLRHWIDELKKLAPHAGEEAELAGKRALMMSAEKILESMNHAHASLSRDDVLSAVRQAQSALDKANRLVNGQYDSIVTALEQVYINADEAIRQIEEASSHLCLNQNEIDTIEQRLYALRGVARKHNVAVEGLEQLLTDMQIRLSNIEFGEDKLVSLEKKERQLKLEYLFKAKELSAKRQEAAKLLDAKVMAELPPLKMEKATFVTNIEELPESAWNAKGVDNVSFMIATNPNSLPGALNKIASGGELARFMLALKVNLASKSNNLTMIFDEVDAGVGGATAQAVGERLARLSKDVQVLIVTHSPQVAAAGKHHFKVEKKTENNITTTYVSKLDAKQKSEEIARMLAGEHITDEARAAANVLIKG